MLGPLYSCHMLWAPHNGTADTLHMAMLQDVGPQAAVGMSSVAPSLKNNNLHCHALRDVVPLQQ